MKHQIAHDLDETLAKEAAVRAFESYQQRFAEYDPQVNWVNERNARIEFKVKGMKLEGTMGILPRAIELDLDVPFLLRPFKGTALSVIEREVRVWLDKAKRGEISAPT